MKQEVKDMAAGVRHTTESVKAALGRMGYKMLDDEYINMKTHINVEDCEGYKHYCTLGNLLSSKNPRIVSKYNVYSIQNISTYIKNNKLNTTLISTEFINEREKLSFRCVCGSVYQCTFSKLRHRNQSTCNDCSILRRSESRKHSLKFVRSEFSRLGFKPLFDRYTSCEDKLLCEDSDGYIGELSYSNLTTGYTFQIFSKNNPHTVSNIKTYIEKTNLDCRIISKEWVSSESELKFQCECGEQFLSTWKDFSGQNKTRCASCAKSLSQYCLSLERWLNNEGLFYVREYRIEDCKYRATLPFDYAISVGSEVVLCEVDGQHHYKPIMCWGGEDAYRAQQIKDKIKTKYCQNNGIKLIRIPYWKFDNEEYIEVLNKELLGNSI